VEWEWGCGEDYDGGEGWEVGHLECYWEEWGFGWEDGRVVGLMKLLSRIMVGRRVVR
jgi:hypothetical protein